MARKKKRQFTPEDKLRILEEARQPDTTVAEVLRRH
jgi:transposase-like protein